MESGVAKMYFTADEAARLAKISRPRLRRWVSSSVFFPKMADTSPFFTFRDIVGLRVLARLRDLGASLRNIREAGVELKKRADEPWSTLRLGVVRRRVQVEDSAGFSDAVTGQRLLPKWVDIGRVESEMRTAVLAARKRKASSRGKLASDRMVLHGATRIAGTRVPTSAVYSFHRAGVSVPGIIRQYPSLTAEDVDAAIAFEEGRRRKRAS